MGGTEVAAIIYSVLESVLLNDLDPRAFIEYAVKRQIIERVPHAPELRGRARSLIERGITTSLARPQEGARQARRACT